MLALPLLALPAMLAGIAVSPGLLHAGLVSITGFVLLAAAGAVSGVAALIGTSNRQLVHPGFRGF